MDVRIGVTDIARELVVNSASTPDEIEAQVTQAFADPKGTLVLVDDKGKRVLVPAAKLAYVEIAPADGRRVGFMVGS